MMKFIRNLIDAQRNAKSVEDLAKATAKIQAAEAEAQAARALNDRLAEKLSAAEADAKFNREALDVASAGKARYYEALTVSQQERDEARQINIGLRENVTATSAANAGLLRDIRIVRESLGLLRTQYAVLQELKVVLPKLKPGKRKGKA
jgi:hypothetical protein